MTTQITPQMTLTPAQIVARQRAAQAKRSALQMAITVVIWFVVLSLIYAVDKEMGRGLIFITLGLVGFMVLVAALVLIFLVIKILFFKLEELESSSIGVMSSSSQTGQSAPMVNNTLENVTIKNAVIENSILRNSLVQNSPSALNAVSHSPQLEPASFNNLQEDNLSIDSSLQTESIAELEPITPSTEVDAEAEIKI